MHANILCPTTDPSSSNDPRFIEQIVPLFTDISPIKRIAHPID